MRVVTLMLLAGCAARSPAGDDTDTTPPGRCETLGLTAHAWQEGSRDAQLNDLAGDVTLPTTAGDITLSEAWTGCESWLFVLHNARQTQGFGVDPWDDAADVRALLQNLPDTAHLVFVSDDDDRQVRQAAIDTITRRVDKALERVDADGARGLADRVHYVTKQAGTLGGWLGELLHAPGWGVAVDRLQRVRFLGSYANPDRYDNGVGWFGPDVSMVANEARYYDFTAARQERLDAEDVTVVSAWQGEVVEDGAWAGVRSYVDITLPDAATMATFNHLELDATMACVGDGEYGTCPAWDYLVHAWLCDAADPETCDVELGRWVTTYHREGRWVHDVTPLLPLLRAGGQRRLAFYSTQPYELTLDLRLRHVDGAPTPVWAERVSALSGSKWLNGDVNDADPVTTTLPGDATAFTLATVASGHEQVDPGTCAEFCVTETTFTVDGTAYRLEHPEAGTRDDCMAQVDEGTIPNQYGTWWYGRNGWCPGKEVPVRSFDLGVTPGANVSLDMTVTVGGQPYEAGARVIYETFLVGWR